MQRRREKLGIKQIHFFDTQVDLSGQPALTPFKDVRELTDKTSRIFHHVHPKFGEYFDIMDKEGLLDLENRKNKAAGGYCTQFAHSRRPFIFANAVGIHDDVQTLLHEGGHCFHAFETFQLPYFHQYAEVAVPIEFAEVASMGMELLSLPYQEEKNGGFYSPVDATRARVDHLESSLMFWPYMAIVDAFQHWVYENFDDGINPSKCDEKWAELEKRFRPYLDWTGYEEVMKTGWQRKGHIHQVPFYYVEYGLALLGAVQIWANAIKDQAGAVEQYRKALALGGTVTLPELFKAAGARLAFDAQTLKTAADLMENTINDLEKTF
jgi:oligoendopeptidase F